MTEFKETPINTVAHLVSFDKHEAIQALAVRVKHYFESFRYMFLIEVSVENNVATDLFSF